MLTFVIEIIAFSGQAFFYLTYISDAVIIV